jgi:hypothetical protein
MFAMEPLRFLAYSIPIALASLLFGGLLYYESSSETDSGHAFVDAMCQANRQSAHGAQYSRSIGTKGRKRENCCDLDVFVNASDRPPFEAALLERSCQTPDFISTSQPDACSNFFSSIKCSDEAEICDFPCKFSPQLLGSTNPNCVVDSRNTILCITGGVVTPLEYFLFTEHDRVATANRPIYLWLMIVPAVFICILCFAASVLPSCNPTQYTLIPGSTINKTPQNASSDTSDAARPPGSDPATIDAPAPGGG